MITYDYKSCLDIRIIKSLIDYQISTYHQLFHSSTTNETILTKNRAFTKKCIQKSQFRQGAYKVQLILIASFRSSHQRCSVKKGVLRNFAKFTGKHLGHVSFLMKPQAETCNFIKKKDLGAGAFLRILRNFQKHRTPPVATDLV